MRMSDTGSRKGKRKWPRRKKPTERAGRIKVPRRNITDREIDTLCTELREVACNLWWSWNPAAQQLFHELSPFFWEHSNHNAVEVVNWISGQELRTRLREPAFF